MFTVLTDDGLSMSLVRAQEKGKALHSNPSNALLGQYIRDRIGVSSGEYVTRQHLENYGRSDITFTQLDEDSYDMDFSTSS